MSESPLRPGALVLTIVLILGAGGRAHSRVKAEKAVTRTMSIAQFEDRVRGGWAGQMIGVTYGAPTEFRFRGRINEKPRNWKPEELKGALDQDDLYVEMTFADVMDRLGLAAITEQYGEAFKDSQYRLWHAPPRCATAAAARRQSAALRGSPL
jgi:hypothetical protein